MPVVYESGNASNSVHFKPLYNGYPPFVVSFYRSKDHASTLTPLDFGVIKHNYGAADPLYGGEFGFDFFDKDVIAEGLSQYYKVLPDIEREKDEGKKTKKETFNGSYAYLCPYLSIWPPNVDGNMDEKNKKHIVTLYARLEKSSKHDKNISDILTVKFESTDDQVITINGKAEYTIDLKFDLKSGDALIPLTIECKKPFGEEKEVAILAKTRDKKDGSMDIVGKVVVYPNAVRYKTTVQLVKVKFDTTESIGKETPPQVIKDLIDAFNTVSFNQAYIYTTLNTQSEIITLRKEQFTKENELIYDKLSSENRNEPFLNYSLHDLYSNLIENRYAAITSTSKDALTKNKAGEELGDKMNALLAEFDNHYNYFSEATYNPVKIKRKKERKIAETAWNKPSVQKAYTEYLAAKKKYETVPETSSSLDKTHKIHIFYTEEIYAGDKKEEGEVLAYSGLSSGVTHIFNKALANKNSFATILHEIGHSLGLDHTFSEELKPFIYKEEGKTYKDDVEKEIEELQDKIKEYNKDKKNIQRMEKQVDKGKVNIVEALKLLRLENNGYSPLLSVLTKAQGKIGIDDKDFFKFSFLQLIQKIIEMENNKFNIVDSIESIEDIEKIITNTEKKITVLNNNPQPVEKSKELSTRKSKTETKENYMDYTTSDSTVVDTTVERKVFYKWQWDTIRRTGVESNYFE